MARSEAALLDKFGPVPFSSRNYINDQIFDTKNESLRKLTLDGELSKESECHQEGGRTCGEGVCAGLTGSALPLGVVREACVYVVVVD